MSDLPELDMTPELAESIENLREAKSILYGFGLDESSVLEVFAAVRKLDAEIVSAVHEHRIRGLKPHYPESFQAEERGYETVEKWLRATLPKEWNL